MCVPSPWCTECDRFSGWFTVYTIHIKATFGKLSSQCMDIPTMSFTNVCPKSRHQHQSSLGTIVCLKFSSWSPLGKDKEKQSVRYTLYTYRHDNVVLNYQFYYLKEKHWTIAIGTGVSLQRIIFPRYPQKGDVPFFAQSPSPISMFLKERLCD